MHLPLPEAVLISCDAQLAERREAAKAASISGFQQSARRCTQAPGHSLAIARRLPGRASCSFGRSPPRRHPRHPPVPVLHPRLRADGLLQGQPMHVQELLQLLQLRGSARLPCPAGHRGADSGHHAWLFAFQKRLARFLQTRLVRGDVGAGWLVQMHGPGGAASSLAPGPAAAAWGLLRAPSLKPTARRARCHRTTARGRWHQPGRGTREEHGATQPCFCPRRCSRHCNGLVFAGAQMGNRCPRLKPIMAKSSEGRGLPVGMERRPCFPGLIFR